MAGLNFQALSGQPFGFRSVAAAGSSQGTATALAGYSAVFYQVTGADGTKAVKLPDANKGKFIVIKNDDAANAALPVYPFLADTVNGGSANAAYTMAANSCSIFIGTSTGNWITLASAAGGAGSSTVLTSAHLFVGNGSNVATDVAASGDVSLANTGAFTVTGLNGAATATTGTEANFLHSVTAGTTAASKAVVVDANKRTDALVLGTLSLGAGAGTAVTSTAAELNVLHSVTAGTAAASSAVVLDSNTAVAGVKVGLGAGVTSTGAGGSVGSLVDITNATSGTTQNTEYTLNSVTLKANSFNANTRCITIEAWGTLAANANAKNVKLYFGGTAISTVTGTTASGKSYYAYGSVIRLNSNSQTTTGSIQVDTAVAPVMFTSATVTETDTADIVVALKTANTAAAAASGTGQGMIVTFGN
jgi:hypothetical protein